jgi:hypothetical protein
VTLKGEISRHSKELEKQREQLQPLVDLAKRVLENLGESRRCRVSITFEVDFEEPKE